MKLLISDEADRPCYTVTPSPVIATLLAISIFVPIQATAATAAEQQERIEALEKRVRILERLLTEQYKTAIKTSSGSKKNHSARTYKPIHTVHKPKVSKPDVQKTEAHQAPTSSIEPPNFATDKKFHLKGITITPGGFFAGEGFTRSRYQQSDVGSFFSGIPLGNNPLHYMRETRLSARQSRFSGLVEGVVNPETLLSGYVEVDFLGNGSANSTESNSFDLRLRHAYLNNDWNNWGVHLLAGQTWSLATTNFKGITPRNELPPPTIDTQYVVGFVWKRQPQLRLVKNLGELFTAAISIENAQTTFGGTPCGTNLGNGVINQICFTPGIQTLPNITLFSLNNIPDVIGKLAYEDTLKNHKVHIEGFGLHRNFYNRVRHTPDFNNNHNTSAYGIGAGGLIEVIPKRLDFQGNFLAGRGIGSYASGFLPDATISSNGALAAIPEVIFMTGATLHATSKLDFYVYGGQEKEDRKYFRINQNYFGYGVPNANNTGCNIEYGICDGNNQALWQVTTGLWNKFYQGDYGDLRAGLQYSYTVRKIFSGNGGQTNIIFPKYIGYQTYDQMVFASLRYYPFTTPAVSPATTK
ncbi:hypothetical protein [Legionella quateirensis]|uniref:Uncharacterized protein n=1 Tax=Legionella quateirensis TaxID=45072 RepID=A0A378KXU1_9GAMM|nr:hypothetical protein [Legionella quateirensis]KTD48353.1 hypothetical protein Lqua_1882 [Legionella quateirensis]STY18317.1 Uncharacterised protein [Legionella quateirensis]